jgi:5,10-methenyltetrahydrofolate synthetase
MSYKTKRLVSLAMLIAMEIVLSRFLSISSAGLKISLAFLPIVVAAMMYGPLWAGAAGGLADLVGAVLFPIGAYFPGFTLTAFLRGAVYGLFLYNQKFRMSRVNAAVGVVCLVLNLGLDTYWLYLIMGSAVSAYIPGRALTNGAMILVQALVTSILFRVGQPMMRRVIQARLDDYRMRARRFFAEKPQLRAALSAAITARALALPQYQKAETVFCFVGTSRELDTGDIIRQALLANKVVCVPLCEADGVMTARRIDSLAALNQTGSFGILEPDAAAPVVARESIDLAFIPCSAADRRRNRIGKGGGYYDRYLAGATLFKAALCPAGLLVSRLPAAPHDIPVDVVVTERAYIG